MTIHPAKIFAALFAAPFLSWAAADTVIDASVKSPWVERYGAMGIMLAVVLAGMIWLARLATEMARDEIQCLRTDRLQLEAQIQEMEKARAVDSERLTQALDRSSATMGRVMEGLLALGDKIEGCPNRDKIRPDSPGVKRRAEEALG